MTAIRADLARPTPMLRLLQGDVGSGKTAVAAYALAAAARAGLQGALLAPTDLLARQHLETVGALLDGPRHRRDAADRLAQGRRQGQGARGDRVGPGARSSSGPTRCSRRRSRSPDLGLVVIDEQHRFGVDQRGAARGEGRRPSPHVLLMTATPIPRTLGQVLYADLDVSDLRTPPAGRVRDPDRGPAPGRPRRTWAQGSRGGGARAPDVRRRAAHRGGRRRRATAPWPPRARPTAWRRCSPRSGSASSTAA